MFDFLSGLGGGITSLLPAFGGMMSGAGGLLGKATDMFTGFLGNKPKTPITMPNIQKSGGNYLLDSMTPETAGVFQGMGVNPQGFAMQPQTGQGQGQGDIAGMLQSLGQSGLLDQEQPQFMQVPPTEYAARQQIQPVDLQQYYKNLMSNRQGLL
tara:strand:+ start:442 stop:903 length:462 start_codon:yes stop_codon:yes gene_type:complete